MMRSILILLLLHSFLSNAQVNLKDKLKAKLENEKVDTGRIFIMAQLSNAYKDEKPVIGLSYAQQGILLAKKIKFLKGEAACMNALGNNYRRIGEFTKGLQAHLDALKIFEKLEDPVGLMTSLHGISVNYEDREEYDQALDYAYKVLPIASRLKNNDELMRIQSNMGKIYERLGRLDSALHYEQNAYEIAISTKDSSILGNILSRLGNIYLGLNNPEMALAHYKMGIPIATSVNDQHSLTELYYDIANLYQRQSKIDSALHYAKIDLQVAAAMPLPGQIVKASSLLTALYKTTNVDSAYKYLSLSTITKDSLFTHGKLKQMQFLAFEENKRQAEIIQKEAEEKAEQFHLLQYVAIGILILLSTVIFLLLTNSIIANENWIKFLGIIILLIVFEFINLLLHPFLVRITHHSPILMLLGMVVLASVLVPFHHKLEHWIKVKMVEKNKKVRLAAARRMIEKLEENTESNVE